MPATAPMLKSGGHAVIRRIITLAATIVVAAVFSVVFLFAVTPPDGAPSYSYKDGDIEYTVSKIEDIDETMTIRTVNYTEGEFVVPGTLSPDSRAISLENKPDFSRRGTVQIMIFSLDPADELFDKKGDVLSDYKEGDYWHLSLTLPQIFSASVIYVGNELAARSGAISSYDFSDYCSGYDVSTDAFSPLTRSVDLDIKFHSKRDEIASPFLSGTLVTIHYEGNGGLIGPKGLPIIGQSGETSKYRNIDNTLLLVFYVIAFAYLSALIFLSFLKRTRSFIPQLVLASGLFLAFFSLWIGLGSTGSCKVCLAICRFGTMAALIGATFNTTRDFTRSIQLPPFIVSCIALILTVIVPFIPHSAVAGVAITVAVIKCAVAACVIAMSFLKSVYFRGRMYNTVAGLLVSVASVVGSESPAHFPQFLSFNPQFWLFAAAAIMVALIGFREFFEIEKRNRYLTANLNAEVAQQTADLREVVSERDEILRFVSHDLKKPLLSSEHIISTVAERVEDEETAKALNIIRQKNNDVIAGLSDVAKLAHIGYIAEGAEAVDLEAMFKKIYDDLNPDCSANGIAFDVKSSGVKPYAKPKGLESTLQNLIINAIEHADCTHISVMAKSRRGKCSITVSDNGKGYGNRDIFRPYVSEKNDEETSGLGLYICKTAVTKMNGELEVSRIDGRTVFTITLPLA